MERSLCYPPWDFRHGKRTVTRPKMAIEKETYTDQQGIVYHVGVKGDGHK